MGDVVDAGRRGGVGAPRRRAAGLGASRSGDGGSPTHPERGRGTRALGRTRSGGVGQVPVDLLQEALDELGVGGLLDQIDDPAALAAHASAAHVEDLDGCGELIAHEAEDIGVGGIGQDHGVALDDLPERLGVVAQARGLLELQVPGRQAHAILELAQVGPGASRHEGAEVLGELTVIELADTAHAGRRALVDVSQQAGAAGGAGALEHSRRAGADGEDAQELVERLADGPRLHEGAEVTSPRPARAAHHLGARIGLLHGDGQVRIGLVVPVHDVESGVELLDPGVLQGQGLHLRAHDRPFHGAGGGHHLLSARVEGRLILEVAGQARPQVLGLADVDDASLHVEEPVDARRRGDLAGCGAVRRRVGHGTQTR